MGLNLYYEVNRMSNCKYGLVGGPLSSLFRLICTRKIITRVCQFLLKIEET